MELEQPDKRIILKNQKKVYRGTNFEDLSTRVINKS